MSNMIGFVIAWGVLALVVLVLAFMRKSVTAHEDDSIHLSGNPDVAMKEQTTVAKKLEAIDKWGKLLTIVLAITGLILAGLYGYSVFEGASTAGFAQ